MVDGLSEYIVELINAAALPKLAGFRVDIDFHRGERGDFILVTEAASTFNVYPFREHRASIQVLAYADPGPKAKDAAYAIYNFLDSGGRFNRSLPRMGGGGPLLVAEIGPSQTPGFLDSWGESGAIYNMNIDMRFFTMAQ